MAVGSSSVASESFTAHAIYLSTGVCMSEAQPGTGYITDPYLSNKLGGVLTLVYAWDAPEPDHPRTEVKIIRAGGGRTANGRIYEWSGAGLRSGGGTVAFTSTATDYDTVPNVSGTRHVCYGDPTMVDVDPSGQSSETAAWIRRR